MKKFILVAGLTAAVGGCVGPAGDYYVKTGDFGDSTMNNSLVMRGEKSYAVSLGQRFAREIPTTVNFEFDSDTLDGQAQQVLDKQADWIRQFPEVRFNVYGYTDKVGSNLTITIWDGVVPKRLSDICHHAGVNRSRLKALVSYGETRPVIDTPNRERQNRRSVTEVAGFVSRHPTVLDGKYAEIVYRGYIESAQPVDGLTRRDNTGGFATE